MEWSAIHAWRLALIIVGVLITTIGYMVERRLASIESQLQVLDTRMDVNAGQTEKNSESLKYLWEWNRPKGDR